MYCIILIIILFFIAYKTYKVDAMDITHPFGTDAYKNAKYTKGLEGDEYGVGTFWGRPAKTDEILDNLNKIQWLSDSSSTDVVWRRALVMSIIAGVVIAFSIDINIVLYDPSKLMFIILFVFLLCYFSTQYYIFHVLYRRKKFTSTHIRRIKSKLNLPLNNKIYENSLI